jgi:hypothetical protein
VDGRVVTAVVVTTSHFFANPQVVFAPVFGCCLVLVFLALSAFVGAVLHHCP